MKREAFIDIMGEIDDRFYREAEELLCPTDLETVKPVMITPKKKSPAGMVIPIAASAAKSALPTPIPKSLPKIPPTLPILLPRKRKRSISITARNTFMSRAGRYLKERKTPLSPALST